MKLFFVTLITLPAFASEPPINIPPSKCQDEIPEYVVIANYGKGNKFIVTSFHGNLALPRCEDYIQSSGDSKYMYCLRRPE